MTVNISKGGGEMGTIKKVQLSSGGTKEWESTTRKSPMRGNAGRPPAHRHEMKH